MNAQTAKITPEVFRVTVNPNNACAYVDGQGTSMGQMAVCYRGEGDHIQRAKFIAESFNVYHETGLTPRQLADTCANLREYQCELMREKRGLMTQRAELLEALDRLVFDLGDLRAAMTNYTPNTAAEIDRAMNRASAAAAKATGAQP